MLLPPAGTDPAETTPESLTALTEALDAASPQTVELAMPTLELEPPALDLAPALDAAGLGGLYEAPDLSGISTTQGLVVSQALQQAYLSLDEAGTVAAAVTEIGAWRSSAAGAHRPRGPDDVDRPYLLRIAHTETSLPTVPGGRAQPAALIYRTPADPSARPPSPLTRASSRQ